MEIFLWGRITNQITSIQYTCVFIFLFFPQSELLSPENKQLKESCLQRFTLCTVFQSCVMQLYVIDLVTGLAW